MIGVIALPAFVVAIAFLGSWFTSQGLSWYYTLNLPAITPEGSVFGIVWTILFILLAIVGGLLMTQPNTLDRTKTIWVFVLNGIANAAWSYLFFYSHNLPGAFVEIWILNLTIIILLVRLWSSLRLGSILLIPYFLWVSFATYLSYLTLQANL